MVRSAQHEPMPKRMEMATGMHCEGRIPAHSVDSAAGVAYYWGEPRKNTLLSQWTYSKSIHQPLRQAPGDVSCGILSSYSVNPSACWALGKNIPRSVLSFLCQHLFSPPYGHIVLRKKKILYIYIKSVDTFIYFVWCC